MIIDHREVVKLVLLIEIDVLLKVQDLMVKSHRFPNLWKTRNAESLSCRDTIASVIIHLV